MITPIDTHILVGILSKIVEGDSARVELATAVPDTSIKKMREVDITIKYADNTTSIYKALEVKHHKRKLDVIMVEQLCSKFADMPSIQKRGIVSASGYTKDAIKKAQSHNVELYEIITWENARQGFGNILFATNDTPMIETTAEWIAPPWINIPLHDTEYTKLTRQEFCQLPLYEENGQLYEGTPTVQLFCDYIGDYAKNEWAKNNPLDYDSTVDIKPATINFQNIPKNPFVIINGKKSRIGNVSAQGVIERTAIKHEFTFRALIKHGAEEPIAVFGLFETSIGNLMAFLFDDKKTQHLLINIPQEDRMQKTVRKRKLV